MKVVDAINSFLREHRSLLERQIALCYAFERMSPAELQSLPPLLREGAADRLDGFIEAMRRVAKGGPVEKEPLSDGFRIIGALVAYHAPIEVDLRNAAKTEAHSRSHFWM